MSRDQNNKIPTPVANAFISCSLRNEDEKFVTFIEKILRHCKVEPMGTVGRHSIAPVPVVDLMKKNIPLADFLVVVATPRYVQRDMTRGGISQGLSEMIHVEAGMAYMLEKPVVVFVKEGTAVGNFLPNITQYITLDGSNKNVQQQWPLIVKLLSEAINQAKQKKDAEEQKRFGRMLTNGLAILGGIKVFNYLTTDDES